MRREGRTYMTNVRVIVAFRNFAKAPKNPLATKTRQPSDIRNVNACCVCPPVTPSGASVLRCSLCLTYFPAAGCEPVAQVWGRKSDPDSAVVGPGAPPGECPQRHLCSRVTFHFTDCLTVPVSSCLHCFRDTEKKSNSDISSCLHKLRKTN